MESCNNMPIYGYMLPNLSRSPILYKVQSVYNSINIASRSLRKELMMFAESCITLTSYRLLLRASDSVKFWLSLPLFTTCIHLNFCYMCRQWRCVQVHVSSVDIIYMYVYMIRYMHHQWICINCHGYTCIRTHDPLYYQCICIHDPLHVMYYQ